MKKLFLILFFALALVSPAFAGIHHLNVTNSITEVENDNNFGAKLDAPNLVKLNENWAVGVEGGKDLNGTNNSEGWFTYGKLTYSGSLFNLSK